MIPRTIASSAKSAARAGLLSAMIVQLSLGNAFAAAPPTPPSRDNDTSTPIKHVIVIIGENRSFDHVFATYVPKKGERVWNLLSEGIVNADGTPDPNFSKAEQSAASETASDLYLLDHGKVSCQKSVLPAPLVGGPTDSYVKDDSLTLAQQSENGLPADYYGYLVTGGTGQASRTPDARITNVRALPTGPFQL